MCALVAATLATGPEVAAMKVRRLGRTGLKFEVSVIGVGTWQLGGEWGRRFTQPEVDRLLGRARELGVNLVDTAECYGDHLAEALIGGAIHQQRDDWVVATKFGHRFHPEAVQQGNGSPARLRTNSLDADRGGRPAGGVVAGAFHRPPGHLPDAFRLRRGCPQRLELALRIARR